MGPIFIFIVLLFKQQMERSQLSWKIVNMLKYMQRKRGRMQKIEVFLRICAERLFTFILQPLQQKFQNNGRMMERIEFSLLVYNK